MLAKVDKIVVVKGVNIKVSQDELDILISGLAYKCEDLSAQLNRLAGGDEQYARTLDKYNQALEMRDGLKRIGTQMLEEIAEIAEMEGNSSEK